VFDKAFPDLQLQFVIDFTKIEVINSPGAASLLSIVSHIVDDFDGRVVAHGLNSHHLAVLEMAGFFYLAQQAPDEESALVIARGKD